MKRFKALAIAALIGAGIVTVAPTAAHAAGRDGVCNDGEFCLYYNSDNEGSISDFTGSISDYGATQPSCYEFKGAGAGQDLCVKNEAASVWNRSEVPVTVYFNSGYGGAHQGIAAGKKVNLNSKLKNENASHKFGVDDTADENLTHGLYNASGTITCGFDRYTTTPGRHEGIDMARELGAPVRALLSGKVINIVRGSTGSGGLSTIAIYHSGIDATIIYLHSAPLASLSEGDTVTRDQQIATESWRGVGSSSAAHTHVEYRPGRKELAAVSSDETLVNPNPTAFWNARGYNVR
ncbi:peptidase inhibitor family I36 protein [Winogradskya humida]|uniref:M23ase beta-sheet core domain-containing protein n=1 Tax=Winogradskya humida TaxID=113566 RepID=A0ABQ3ZYE1_9ACTN|nr:peptidase inhibitor family I36 protein [Actinoplanes humidus]GIE23606.1 hypothetical protein Ahu01nite_067080 [Actinoplanes humidus]